MRVRLRVKAGDRTKSDTEFGGEVSEKAKSRTLEFIMLPCSWYIIASVLSPILEPLFSQTGTKGNASKAEAGRNSNLS